MIILIKKCIIVFVNDDDLAQFLVFVCLLLKTVLSYKILEVDIQRNLLTFIKN